MVGLNIVMVAYFVEGMEESGSVAGTGLASAANFAVSALYGIVLWGEQVNAQWCGGFALVVVGVALLSTIRMEQ
jgi:drug/metabolite transporter (DMT)-like permease